MLQVFITALTNTVLRQKKLHNPNTLVPHAGKNLNALRGMRLDHGYCFVHLNAPKQKQQSNICRSLIAQIAVSALFVQVEMLTPALGLVFVVMRAVLKLAKLSLRKADIGTCGGYGVFVRSAIIRCGFAGLSRTDARKPVLKSARMHDMQSVCWGRTTLITNTVKHMNLIIFLLRKHANKFTQEICGDVWSADRGARGFIATTLTVANSGISRQIL